MGIRVLRNPHCWHWNIGRSVGVSWRVGWKRAVTSMPAPTVHTTLFPWLRWNFQYISTSLAPQLSFSSRNLSNCIIASTTKAYMCTTTNDTTTYIQGIKAPIPSFLPELPKFFQSADFDPPIKSFRLFLNALTRVTTPLIDPPLFLLLLSCRNAWWSWVLVLLGVVAVGVVVTLIVSRYLNSPPPRDSAV